MKDPALCKSEIVGVKLTPDEMKKLEDEAWKLHLGKSTYIRQTLLNRWLAQ